MTVSLLSFFYSTVITWLLLLTRPFHEKWTGDHSNGAHNTHRHPALRIGGVPIYFAMVGNLIYLGWVGIDATTAIYRALLLGALIVTFFGLIEDITGKIRPRWRLVAAFASGAVFVFVGYPVTHVDIPGIDMAFLWFGTSVIVTSFAIAGVTNAVNVIDGFNGLASGALSIMFAGLGLLAYRAGDISLALVSLSFIAVILGFFIFNFPLGRIFLGDGGAYFLGFALAANTIMLFERNDGISPWTATLVIAYPITEMLISIMRRVLLTDAGPASPDILHMHHLIHRSFARPIARRLGHGIESNPVTGVLMWGFPTLSVIFAQIGFGHTGLSVLGFVLFILIYLVIYARVALMRPGMRRRRSWQKA